MARFTLQPDGSGLFGPLSNGYYVYSPPDVKDASGKSVAAGDQSQVKIVDKSGAPVPGYSNQDALAAANSDPTYGTHEPGTGAGTNPVGSIPIVGQITDKYLGTGAYAPTSTTGTQQAAQTAQQTADQFGQSLRTLKPGTAPTIQSAGIDQNAANQSRGAQYDAIKSYKDVLSGAAPSVAQIQLGRTLQTNVLNQTGAAAGARGTNQALAQRTAANNIAQLNAGAGSDAALLRAQEQDAARAGLSTAATTARSQDLGVATGQATLDQDAASKNQSSAVTTRAQDIAEQNAKASQDLLAQSQAQAAQQQLFNNTNTNKTQQQAVDSSIAGDVSRAIALGGGGGETVPGAQGLTVTTVPAQSDFSDGTTDDKKNQTTLSDRRAKTDIKPERSGFVAMLRTLEPAKWEYKDPANGAGKQFGVMAQDLEKTPVGQQLVVQTPKGKAIDAGKSIGPILASLKLLTDRLDKIDGGKK